MAKDKTEDKRVVTPEGMILNASLFKKDEFKGEERYRLELAVDPDDAADFEDQIVAFAAEEMDASEDDVWDMIEDGDFNMPVKDGNRIAKDRERRNKKGDAYRGKMVIKPMDTIYNKDGDDGPGGIEVIDEDNEDIVTPSEIYRGAFGQAVVTFSYYDNKDKGVKLYLKAFKKTKNGERLSGGGSAKDLFEGSRSSGRERRSRR